jgi:acetyl esterase/lipase
MRPIVALVAYHASVSPSPTLLASREIFPTLLHPAVSNARMLRISFLILALSLLALGLLTVFKSPDWSPWRLAVLAGEYGHWLALAALGLAVGAWCVRVQLPLAIVTLAVGVVAAALLAKPSWQAWRVGAALPQSLEAQFGPAALARAPFSPANFFGGNPSPVAIQTLAVTPELPLDFYPTERPSAPCVIVVHAGGWDSGDRKQIPHFNHWLARQGYAVAAISYRLAPKHLWPAQRDDVLAALAFLKSRAAELRLDPQRFVLLGRSAGGQIAEAVGYSALDPAIRGVIGLYAPSDLIFGYVNTHENDMLKSPALMRKFLGGTPDSARANYESASAIFHVTRRSPPTLLLHGTLDAVAWYRHSVRLDAKLAEHGVPHAFVHLPWATHAFDFNLHGPGGQLTTYAVEWFLARVTQ